VPALFLDTYFVQALLNPKDLHHARALTLLPQDAVTGDRHFVQAGFRALMLDTEP
jgi:predicted nucleic acid-binding protein